VKAAKSRLAACFFAACFLPRCPETRRRGALERALLHQLAEAKTQYLTKAAIKMQVRDPQSLRYFPKSRMSSFPASLVSDKELDDLIAYLGHMAKHKVAAK
jgi:hypothetical protein